TSWPYLDDRRSRHENHLCRVLSASFEMIALNPYRGLAGFPGAAAYLRSMRSHHRAFRCLAAGGLLAGLLGACSSAAQLTRLPDAPSTAGLTGIHKIQHVIIVM